MADGKFIQVGSVSENKEAGALTQVFPGELVLAQANVMKYDCMSDRSSGIVGNFYVTNFKIAFVASSPEQDSVLQTKDSSASLAKLLCEELNQRVLDYVPLTAILNVYAISTTKLKRKRLKPSKNGLSLKYDTIEIHTKDMRVLNYDFKFAHADKQKECFQKLMCHLFPHLASNLFAYDLGKEQSEINRKLAGRAFCTFTNQKDYELELSRLLVSEKWRVSTVNYGYALCKSLPEYSVCPASLNDEVLKDLAYSYLEQRFPVWLWSDPNSGASLLISSTPRSDDEFMEGHPEVIMQHIKESHAQHTGSKVHVVDVGLFCPGVKLVQESYNLIRNACLLHSTREFWLTDSDWLSKVEGSRWLEYVHVCLNQAVIIATQIKESNTSVIVHEICGRNFSILISSLAQILLDPYYRTIIGFEALIQKDWVMKGHPFAKRLAHLKTFKVVKDFTIKRGNSLNRSKDTFVSYDVTMRKSASMESIDYMSGNGAFDGDCPLFLLFLDAVYQLMQQFPMKFEYTEHFLISLMDCAYSCLFETFLFDSPFERHRGKPGVSRLMSAWDFLSTSIPSAKRRAVFVNPSFCLQGTTIFEARDMASSSSSNSSSSSRHSFYSALGNDVLHPDTCLCSLDFWSGYFLRWLPCADIQKGCCKQAVLHVQQKQLVEEIQYLMDRAQHLQNLCMKMRSSNSSTCSQELEGSITEGKADPPRASSRARKHPVENNYLDLINGFYFLKLLA